MAIIIGESGAWSDVRDLLADRCDLEITHSRDLPAAVNALRTRLPTDEQNAARHVLQSAEAALDKIERDREALRERQKSQRRTYEANSGDLVAALADADQLSGWRWPIKLWRRIRLAAQNRLLEVQHRKAEHDHDKETERLKRAEKHLRMTTPDRQARAVETCRNRLQEAERLASSPELAGAQAETEVIETLRTLPDTFTVLNDLRLEAKQ